MSRRDILVIIIKKNVIMNGGGWTGLVFGGLVGLGTGSFGGFLAFAVIGCLLGIISDPDRRNQ